jgi:hypothetical protein
MALHPATQILVVLIVRRAYWRRSDWIVFLRVFVHVGCGREGRASNINNFEREFALDMYLPIH